MTKLMVSVIVAIAAGCATGGIATAQQGPVAKACAVEMAELCAGKQHVRREMRNCLEANIQKVTPACRSALETTGPGKGQGQRNK